LVNGNNGATIMQQNIPVSVGSYLYFIISPKANGDCDTIYLEVLMLAPIFKTKRLKRSKTKVNLQKSSMVVTLHISS